MQLEIDTIDIVNERLAQVEGSLSTLMVAVLSDCRPSAEMVSTTLWASLTLVQQAQDALA